MKISDKDLDLLRVAKRAALLAAARARPVMLEAQAANEAYKTRIIEALVTAGGPLTDDATVCLECGTVRTDPKKPCPACAPAPSPEPSPK